MELAYGVYLAEVDSGRIPPMDETLIRLRRLGQQPPPETSMGSFKIIGAAWLSFVEHLARVAPAEFEASQRNAVKRVAPSLQETADGSTLSDLLKRGRGMPLRQLAEASATACRWVADATTPPGAFWSTSNPVEPTERHTMDHREWQSLLKRAHELVQRDPSAFVDAGRWLDSEYSEEAVRQRRHQEEANQGPCTHASAAQIPGTPSGRETRLWRLSCVVVDWQHEPPDVSMQTLDDRHQLARRVLLVVCLLTDRKASTYAAGLTDLARLTWAGQDRSADFGRGWCLCDDLWDGEPPWDRLLLDALDALETPTIPAGCSDSVPLTVHDLAILRFLARTPRLRRKVSDILPDDGPGDRKVIGQRLRKLADRTPPLVDYPKGTRQGVAITPAGIATLAQAAPSPR